MGRGFLRGNLKSGTAEAYRFRYCSANTIWSTHNHSPESLPDMRERGHESQHCLYCEQSLVCMPIDNVLHYGKWIILEWP